MSINRPRFPTRLAGMLLISIFIVGLAVHGSINSEAAYTRGGQYGGTLVQAIVGDPPHLNPGITTDSATLTSTSGIFESLLRWDDNLTPYPALAERWDVSPDAKVYTFYLVKNATWHDGAPFTAYDVKFSLEIILKRYHPRARFVLSTLDKVEVIDNYTAKVYFKEPNSAFLYSLNVFNAPMLPRHILEAYADNITRAPFNEKPIGTGPFRFVEWVKGQYVKLEKNPSYYIKGFPYLDAIVTRIFRDPLSAVLALERGEVDYIPGYYMPPSEAKRLQGRSDIVVTSTGSNAISPVLFMFYNLDREPTSSKEFRKAVALAIDRQAILDKVFFGFGRVATGPIASAHWAYNPNVTRYSYDPEAAKKILDSLGYRDVDGDGYRESPNGSKLTLILPYYAGVSFHERTAQLIAEMLRNVGIKVELRPYDTATLINAVYINRDFHLAMERLFTGPDPAISVARLYHSSYASSKIAYTNAAPGYRNPTVDKLLDDASRAIDRAERARLYAQFQAIVADDLPILPLIEADDPNTMRSNVKGLHTWSAESRVERVDVWIETRASTIMPQTTASAMRTQTMETKTPSVIQSPQATTQTQTGAASSQVGINLIAVAIVAFAALAISVALYMLRRR